MRAALAKAIEYSCLHSEGNGIVSSDTFQASMRHLPIWWSDTKARGILIKDQTSLMLCHNPLQGDLRALMRNVRLRGYIGQVINLVNKGRSVPCRVGRLGLARGLSRAVKGNHCACGLSCIDPAGDLAKECSVELFWYLVAQKRKS